MSETPHDIIHRYYHLYNNRRFEEAGALFSPDAVLEHAPYGGEPRRGGGGYVDSANLSIQAFPDAQVEVVGIHARGDTVFEVDLVATGTHLGTLDLGIYGRFDATGATIRVRHREALDIRDGLIVYASVTLDAQELVAQLSRR